MINQGMINNKKLVFIAPIMNYVLINVLDTAIITKYKEDPNKLLILGINDLYNVLYRVSQVVITNKVQESSVKDFTEKVLNTIVANILKASLEKEAGCTIEELANPVNKTITEKDKEFLKSLHIIPWEIKDE